MATSGKNHINILTYWKLELEWRQVSQSIANNTTTVEAKVYWGVTGGSNGGSATNTGSINIGGQTGNISYTSALSQNQRKLLGTVTKDITHDSNGKKSITISASIPINLTLNGTYVGTQTVSLTADLNDIPRASTITTFDDFSIGNNIPWAVDRKYSAYTHNLRLIVDGTTIVNENTTSASGTLSISSANKIAILNKLSKTGKTVSAKLEVRTYTNSNYNVQVGSTVSKTVVGTARDDDIRPTVGAISHSEYVSMPSGITAYIQNKSRLTIGVAGSSGQFGATISSTKITFAGRTINSASGTTSVINQAGTFKILVEITDTRNVTQTKESTDIEVLAYFSPIISDVSIQRTNSSGVVDPLGIYLTVKAKITVASILIGGTEKNSIWYQADSGRVGQSYSSKVNTTDESLEKSFTHTFSGYLVDYAYNVRVRGGDIFDWTGYIAGAIPTGIVLQHWGSDTTSFGKMIDSTSYNILVGPKGIDSEGGYNVATNINNDNQSPQWYWDNFGGREIKEFKLLSSIGLGNATGTYCTLHTIVPWGDSSGGEIVQIAYGDNNEIYNRGSLNATTWRAWSVFALGGKEEHYYQGSGTTSQGGDLWIANHDTLKSVMEFDLITVNGGSASGYVFHKYKNTNAHNIRLYDDKMVVQKAVAITYSAKITIFP